MDGLETKRGRGRPKGIAREGKYGTGIKTKVVRVPVAVAENIEEILASFDAIKLMVDDWDSKIVDATQQSVTGKVPARYDHAMKLLQELRIYLGD